MAVTGTSAAELLLFAELLTPKGRPVRVRKQCGLIPNTVSLPVNSPRAVGLLPPPMP